ncbi:polyketide synthase [Skermania sp. ID1734]|uniref:acyl carrier protein n=1 Tax=Skermania sp. ID1734 TaxID=2597516 RepID=UPI00117E0D40|nr:acyl carrier protein [Skermania sp. ID1734]TSE01535.1 polyketide synthase [Skermania sp. ID1734]
MTTADIVDWLIYRVAAHTEQPRRLIDTTIPLAELGIASLTAVALCGEVEDEWDIDADPTMVFDYPTILDLAGFIAAEVALRTERAA